MLKEQLYFTLFLLSISSRQVVNIKPLSLRNFLNPGSSIASISAFLFSPLSVISEKMEEGSVQCMITIVTPGFNSISAFSYKSTRHLDKLASSLIFDGGFQS